jgi:PKD repeat protein
MTHKTYTRALLLGLLAWVGFSTAASAQIGSPKADTRKLGPTSTQRAPTRTQAQRRIAARISAQHTNPNSRVGSELQRLYKNASRATVTKDSLRAGFPRLRFNRTASSVLVRITAEDVNALLPSLTSRGFVVISSYPELHFVEGMLPVKQLAAGAAGIEGLTSRGLLGVLPSRQPRVHVGSVTSEGDYVLEAARARATRPRLLDGTGVRVGVMSDSYNALQGAAAGVASGDLPAAGVQVLQDLSDEDATATDEGRAMCEIVHDLAPGSPLVFSSVYYGAGDFAQQIRNLADPTKGNCQVLTDDIGYYDEPFYQDGVIAQAVNQVVASRNVVYFSAAGNDADQSYENNSPVFTQAATGTDTAFRLNFDATNATSDVTQRITLADTNEFFPILQWSDPFYTVSGVKTDLDMYLIAVKNGVATTDTVASSTDNNLLTRYPIEGFDFTNDASTSGTTTFDLVIVRRAGTANPARLKYINTSATDGGPSEWLTSSSTIVGQAAATSAFAVGATPYIDQLSPEYFTSKGGTLTYLFSPNGTALSTPTTRFKPDIAATDGVSTSFFGQSAASIGATDGNLHFFGTSAAAPHAAAVAALLRQSEPTLTPTLLYARLTSTARDIAPAGVDALTGAGLIDAYRAIYGPVAATTPPAVENLETGALPPSWQVSSTRAGRVQVRTTDGPASGSYHLVLDAPYRFAGSTATQSLNQATWFLTGVNANNLQLNFRERKFAGETDEAMPATFTGSSNTDGVAMSVDGGTTWYRVADLTSTNAITTYQTKSVNLTQFASTNGLTLGSDVRLKFQQYGGASAVASAASQQGRLFDDIALTAINPAPVPLYKATPTIGCPNLVVAFADTSELRPTAWAWSFPGGVPSSSTQRNPSVTYPTPGHYGVTLTVTNAAGLQATRADTGVVFVYGRAPLATVAATRTSLCPGGQTTFSSPTASYCAATYNWSFPGGSPASASVQNPGVVTYAAAGNYTATLTVSNAYGSSTSSIAIEVTSGRAIPFIETFEAALTIPAGWTVVNPDLKYTWTVRDTTISRSGQRSRVLRAPSAFDPDTTQLDALYTPALNLTGIAQPTLLFDLAYAPYGNGSKYRDSLTVQIADACTGAILGRPYAKGSTGTLPTAAGRNNLFVPASGGDWRQERIDLTPYAGRSIVIRFVSRNGYGNSLYLDNVQVGNSLLALTSTANTVGLEAWPNPVPHGTILHLRLPPYAGAVSVRLVDGVGRVVWQEQVQQNGAALDRDLALPLAPGIYNLLYIPASGQAAARRIALE